MKRLTLAAALIAALAIPGTIPGTAHAADPVIAAVGDAVCAAGQPVTATTCQHKAVSDLILRNNVTRVLILGDAVYENGDYTAFDTQYRPSYGRLDPITCPVPGNHEYRTANAAGFFRYFAGRVSQSLNGKVVCPIPGAPNWTVVGVNSSNMCYPVSCTDQVPFLNTELEKAPTCELGFWHHPRYSSAAAYNASTQNVYPFVASMNQRRGDLILNGHVHSYERLNGINQYGNLSTTAPRTVISGAGGKNFQPFGTTRAGSAARITGRFGAAFITLHPNSYSVRFKDINNNILDQALNIPCRA